MNKNIFSVSWKTIGLVLLATNILTLAFWQPWTGSKRTVTVTGEGTIHSAPNEFTFSPAYQAKGKTSQEAIVEVSKTGNAVVAKLKELGLKESAITTNVSTSPDYEIGIGKVNPDSNIANFSITAKVGDKDLANKILNYLVTTPVLYAASPASTFDTETRQKLELEARGLAVANARIKADQSAKALGLKVKGVQSVSDLNQNFGPPILLDRAIEDKAIAPSPPTSPTLEVGEQELSFSVTVVFVIG